MQNRSFLIALFCLFTCTVFAQVSSPAPTEKWDLQQCVDYAIAHNISIKQQDVQAKIAALNLRQSYAAQFPTLNAGSNLGLNTGRSIDRTTNQFTTESILYNGFSLQGNVDVFNWFSKRNQVAGDRFQSEASKAAVDKLKNDISLNVAAAYLQVLLAKEQINVSNVQIAQTDSQLYNTRIQVKAGNLPELNVAELEAQLASDSSTLISAVGTERQSILLLQSLLNLDAGQAFDIVAPPIEKIPVDPISELQPEPVYALALKNLPQQQVNKLRLLAAQKYVQAAKGRLYPSLSLGGSLGTNYSSIKNNQQLLSANPIGLDTIAAVSGTNQPVVVPKLDYRYRVFSSPYGTQIGDNFSNSVGLSLSIPIFNGRSARTAYQREKLNAYNLGLQQDLDNMTLKQDIYKAFTDAITSLQKFRATSSQVASAQKAFDFAQKRYDVGLLNTLDLLTNQNNLFRAKIQQLSAQFDYVFKMKVLEFYKGQGLKL